jgi:fibronectin type 3 domain-containing protein
MSVGLLRGGLAISVRVEAPSPRTVTLRISFEGCDPVEPAGAVPLGHGTNYILGSDPVRWVSGARSFSEVWYRGVYEGVDLRFCIKEGALKYDVVLAPGTGAGAVRFAYSGVDGLGVEPASGDLLASTAAGVLRDPRPTVRQDGPAGPVDASGSFILLGGTTYGFGLPPGLDPALPTVIDPGIRFSTFLGGSEEDSPGDIGVDAEGCVYVLSKTNSTDFPVTPGVWDVAGNVTAAEGDLAITKLDPTCSRAMYSTYVGGSGDDTGLAIEVGSDGSVYAAGWTDSTDLPVTNDAIARASRGSEDAFVMRLDPNGTRLLYMSYLGGSSFDYIRDIDLGADGSLYACGASSSPDMPVTPGAFCTTFSPTAQDHYATYMAKLVPSLDRLAYATYVNGGSDEHTWSCQAGAGGDLLVVGQTASSDFPTTSGAFCGTLSGGEDAFALWLDAQGGRLFSSTLLGGPGTDIAYCAGLLPNGSVALAGSTASHAFPTTPDRLNTTVGGLSEGFLTVLDRGLTRLEFSTLLGGSRLDEFYSMTVGPASGMVWVSGDTYSRDLPVTRGCVDPLPRGESMGMLAGINVSSAELVYCTYLGGSWTLFVPYKCLAMSRDGTLYVTGLTGSSGFPATAGALQRSFAGGLDSTLVVLDPTPVGPPDAPLAVEAQPGDGVVYLNWTPVVPENCMLASHLVRRASTGSLADAEVVGNVTWPGTSLEDRLVRNGVTYTYWVSAVNGAGEGPASSPVIAQPLGTPSAPIGLAAATGRRTVRLSWAPPAGTGGNITGYHVLRGDQPSTVGMAVVATLGNVTSVEDANVTCGQRYYYAVRAFNARNEGPPSAVADAVPSGPPSAPQGLSAVPRDGSVELRWSTPANDGGAPVQGYRVLRGGDPSSLMPLGHDLGPLELGILDADLTNGATYYYAVLAINAHGDGDLTDPPLGATPSTIPSEPRDLRAVRGDGEVTLTWQPPALDGGRPVSGYRLYYGKSPDSLPYTCSTAAVTSFTIDHLRNGDTYYFKVAAVNVAGEGPLTGQSVMAVPLGRPGAPTGLAAQNDLGGAGARLSWEAPIYTGGAASLSYRLMRAGPSGGPAPIATVGPSTSYLDASVVGGTTYTYRVVAFNDAGDSAGSGEATVLARTLPGPVVGLQARAVRGGVALCWTAPLTDGGAPIVGYVVYKGFWEQLVQEVARVKVATSYTDTDVTSGIVHYYAVRALTDVGEGPSTATVPATPLDVPGPPTTLHAETSRGRVALGWDAPYGTASFPVTGYRVYRGASARDLEPLAELGPVLSYEDTRVMAGRTYVYAVEAMCAEGTGGRATVKVTAQESFAWAAMAAIALLVVVGVAGAALASRARAARRAAARAPPSASAPVAPAAGPQPYFVEEVFVIYRDGRLIADCARGECRTKDADLMSGMLIAIQGLLQDGLAREGHLERIEYGGDVILMASGPQINLAVVVFGEPDVRLTEQVEETVQRIQGSYAGVIEEWTGDLSLLGGVEDLVRPLLESTASVTRESVKHTAGTQEVSLLSAVDFHAGYVRLKVAAVNATPETITDTVLDVGYDAGMLRLERVEPDTLRPRGDSVALGNIKPGERKTVAFLFDPQICQQTHITGALGFSDARGTPQRVEMKHRTAEVVCPIFFTKEHANTAMLRRLVSEELHQADSRVLRYPRELSPEAALGFGKTAMAMQGVQLVREYVVEGPPYLGEVWYYGQTKVKGLRMVMRLRVLQEGRAMEVFAASTSMEAVTGLLADVRRELGEAIGAGAPEAGDMETSTDPSLRRELAEHQLLLDLIFDGEGRGGDGTGGGQ